jgi:hypothetical protein
MMTAHGEWKLFAYPEGDATKPLCEIPIESEEALLRELRRLIDGPPQHVEIVSIYGAVCLGIGGPYSAVEWRYPCDPNAIFKVLAQTPNIGPKFEFAVSGGGYEESPEFLMPVDEALRIVLHCFRYHAVPPDVKCLNWDHVFEAIRKAHDS